MTESMTLELYMQPMRSLNISTRRLDEPTPMHIHNFYELELVIEGSGTNWINGVSAPIASNLLYLLVPGDMHRIDSVGPLYLIHIGFLPDTENKLPLPDSGYAAHLSNDDMKQIRDFCSIIEQEYLDQKPYRLLSAYSALSLILIHLLRNGRMCVADSTFKKLQPALTYIVQNCCDPDLDLNRVSAACSLSPSYFSNIFHKTFGSSFSSYLTECRLRTACYLLSETATSVSDIVYKCGFSSPSRFFRVFKNRFHTTPALYREQHISLHASEEGIPESLWRHGDYTISAKVDTDESKPLPM